jgi:hypothetical protein
MPQDHRPGRIRAAFASAALAATALAGSLGTASAAPPPPFTLSPDPVSFVAVLNGFDYEFVTLTTGNKRVYMSSPQSTNLPFFDTQGDCWQSYGALGQPIPARTTCQLEIGFHPTAAGPYSDTLTVTACKRWHLDPTYGFILCDTLDGSASVGLEGTVLILPDLVVSGITLGDGGVSPYGFRVTVQNQGDISANISGVTVQGYWSADGTTFDPDNQNPACGQSFPSGTLVGIGGSATLTVNCPAANVSGEEYLGVEADIGDAIVEKDETNNVGFQGLPDLIVESITNDGPSEDHPFNTTATIKNIGVGPAVSNLVVLGVDSWYSADDVLDAGDTDACFDLLFTSPGSIPVNGTVDAHIGCDLVPGAGDAYLLVVADVQVVAYPSIPEVDETNNVGSVALP